MVWLWQVACPLSVGTGATTFLTGAPPGLAHLPPLPSLGWLCRPCSLGGCGQSAGVWACDVAPGGAPSDPTPMQINPTVR